jgi:hypothetical protein
MPNDEYYTPEQSDIRKLASGSALGRKLYNLVSYVPATPTIHPAASRTIPRGTPPSDSRSAGVYVNDEDGHSLNDQQLRAKRQKDRMISKIKARQSQIKSN